MADDPTLTVTEDPADAVVLGDGLTAHAEQTLGHATFRPLNVLARDVEGRTVGGAAGKTTRKLLHVSYLWVDDAQRGRGLGSRLLRRIEDEGRARGCRWVHLDTFGFQAPDFYLNRGYERFGRMDGGEPMLDRHFFRKKLG